ncbi:outer membrane protein assembly factor BamD [bacterium]|nr:MAG: outer membrane protein assembly factor BamD [bacterium]
MNFLDVYKTERSLQLIYRSIFRLMLAAFFATTVISCSGSVNDETSPTERLKEAQHEFDKKHYESASKILEEIRVVTVGTALGGEIQYLLAESNYRMSNYLEADSYFSAYLSGYPGGPHAQDALYKRAMSNLKEIQYTSVGFTGLRKVVPHDRDISLVRSARLNFAQYLTKYPEGEHSEEASEWIKILWEKEGLHELEIASFYLKKKKKPEAALSRANKILDAEYPENIKQKAREIADAAKRELAPNDNVKQEDTP